MIMKIRSILPMALALGLLASGCVEDVTAPPPPPTDAVLVHYWHFNALPEGTLANPIPADFSLLSGAAISYPGTGAGYMDRVDPGSDVNLQRGEPVGFGLRPRNPSNTRELLIVAPSTGYKEIVVQFAVTRTANGAPQEVFEYSTNGGGSWTAAGAPYDIGLDYALKTIDLKGVAGVDNNANLRFRIRFLGEGAAGGSGNNRLDNVTVEGVPLS
jgi:hypothetical protein